MYAMPRNRVALSGKAWLNEPYMNTPVLNDNLRAATEALCNLLAKEDQVVDSLY